jgi:hypothetical protein
MALMRTLYGWSLAGAGLIFCLMLSGCGGPSTVRGKLTNGGQPLTVSDKGVIVMSFSPEGAPPPGFGADVKPDGTFEVKGPENKGVAPGKYRISVQQFDPYPGNDKLDGKFAPGKSPIIRDIKGGSLDIDLAKPEG